MAKYGFVQPALIFFIMAIPRKTSSGIREVVEVALVDMNASDSRLMRQEKASKTALLRHREACGRI